MITHRSRNGAIQTKRRSRPLRPDAGLAGNSEWEAMKARCRNLRPDQAVRVCAYLSAEYRKRWARHQSRRNHHSPASQEDPVRLDRRVWHRHMDRPAALNACH